MPDRADVSVVIPVFNGEETIGNCLKSILSGQPAARSVEILVVDNGSTDRTGEIVASHGVRLVHEANRGASWARNRGIAESTGGLVVFTDADCVASARWLSALTAPFEDEGVSATAGEVLPFPGTSDAQRYIARRKPLWQEWARQNATPWFLAGNVAFRREVFDRIGNYDPAFEAGGEDIDLSWRFFRAGLRLAYCPKAIVFHKNRPTRRTLFRQQMRNGTGQARLRRKYRSEMPWGVRREASAWGDLAASALSALRSVARKRVNGHSASLDVDDVDFLRKLAQRIGFVRGTLEWPSRQSR